MTLETEHAAIAAELSGALREGALTLSTELDGTEVEDCLMRWGIVLAVLGADVLDGIVSLLECGNRRSANMLSRAMADYNVRLRYYFVQAIPRRRALRDHPDKREYILAAIMALRDWKNASAKVALLLSKYDPSTWTEEAKAAILETIAAGAQEESSAFTSMCKYLEANEAKDRGVLPLFADQYAWTYKNYIPGWRMQSCFLHGDQVIVSDVVDFAKDGEPTGAVHMAAPYDATATILFTALDHGTELLRSLAFVRPAGWIMKQKMLRDKVAVAFLKRAQD